MTAPFDRALTDAHTSWFATSRAQRELERSCVFVERGRRELGEPVGVHRSPQVDRFTAGPRERQRQPGGHVEMQVTSSSLPVARTPWRACP